MSLHARLKAKIVVSTTRPGWSGHDALIERGAQERTPAPTPANEPSLLYFTSGTTGHPKMVLHTHASIGLGHEVTGRYWLDLRPGDLHWNIADPGWDPALDKFEVLTNTLFAASHESLSAPGASIPLAA